MKNQNAKEATELLRLALTNSNMDDAKIRIRQAIELLTEDEPKTKDEIFYTDWQKNLKKGDWIARLEDGREFEIGEIIILEGCFGISSTNWQFPEDFNIEDWHGDFPPPPMCAFAKLKDCGDMLYPLEQLFEPR